MQNLVYFFSFYSEIRQLPFQFQYFFFLCTFSILEVNEVTGRRSSSLAESEEMLSIVSLLKICAVFVVTGPTEFFQIASSCLIPNVKVIY